MDSVWFVLKHVEHRYYDSFYSQRKKEIWVSRGNNSYITSVKYIYCLVENFKGTPLRSSLKDIKFENFIKINWST
jgi:hypothetical protein